ncbi:ATP-binding protein [Streptomyces sp. NPDC004065]|uniref:ATP-binding protein n=1 Tax=Streptomyces sp. NPDC004065 TaxID=3364689 RepID=UPI00384DC82F
MVIPAGLSTPPRSSQYVSLGLRHAPEAPAVARRAAKRLLSARGCDQDVLYKVMLVVSELVTNAVVHAAPPVKLSMRIQERAGGPDRVHVSVTDGGPRPRPDGPKRGGHPEEHGRGRLIVSELAEGMGAACPEAAAQSHVCHWATIELRS